MIATGLNKMTARLSAMHRALRRNTFAIAFALCFLSAPASATDLTQWVNHGAATAGVSSFIEFDGAAYFIAYKATSNGGASESEVRRLDPGSQQPVTVSAFDGFEPAQWVVAHDAIVFKTTNGLYAYRSDGTIETIQTWQQDPVESPPGVTTTTTTLALAVFDDRVWFFKNTTVEQAFVSDISTSVLYRLDGIEQLPIAVPEVEPVTGTAGLRVNGDSLVIIFRGGGITNSERATAISRSGSGYAVSGSFFFGYNGPPTFQNGIDGYPDYQNPIPFSATGPYLVHNDFLPFGYSDYNRSTQTLISGFDGAIFAAASIGYDLGVYSTPAGDVVPSIGPNPYDPTNSSAYSTSDNNYNRQIELVRTSVTDPVSFQNEYYELHPQTVNDGNPGANGGSTALPNLWGSSKPNDLKNTENALWFTAFDGTHRWLYRLRRGHLVPEKLDIRAEYPAGEGFFSVTAASDHHLWFRASATGGAVRLFSIAEDSTVAHPIDIGSVGVFSSRIFPWKDEVTMNVRDDNGDFVTYRITPPSVAEATIPTTLMVITGSTSTYVLLSDNTKQWVPESCQQPLIDAGLSVANENWAQINAYLTSSTWYGCDELVALLESDVTPPGGGSDDSIQLLLNGASDTSGYVIINGLTRQWVDAACRQQLVDAGLTATVSSWGGISSYQQATDWQACADLISLVGAGGNPPGGGSDDSIQLLLNGASDTSGYVIINGETQQWIDAACRQQLVAAGLTATVSNWGEISSYQQATDWQTCPDLISLVGNGGNPPGGGSDDSIQLLLNGASDTSGYVIINDQTQQWIDGACRQQLLAAGLTPTVSNWGDISGYESTMDWLTCSELVELVQ